MKSLDKLLKIWWLQTTNGNNMRQGSWYICITRVFENTLCFRCQCLLLLFALITVWISNMLMFNIRTYFQSTVWPAMDYFTWVCVVCDSYSTPVSTFFLITTHLWFSNVSQEENRIHLTENCFSQSFLESLLSVTQAISILLLCPQKLLPIWQHTMTKSPFLDLPFH